MSLPATDDFNRVNANPAGGNWSVASPSGNVQISSNRLSGVSGGSGGFAYWNADTPGNNQYAQCIMPDALSASGGPAVRIQTGTGTRDGYRYNVSAKTLVKWVGGTSTTLQTMTDTVSNSAVYKLEVSDTTLKVYKNGVQLGTDVTDSAHSSGSIGVYQNALTSVFDSWEGGNFTGTNVTADNSTQANASTSGTIGQENIITAGNSTQANASSSGAIVQTILGEVTADNSTQVNESASGGVIQSQTVAADNSTQANTSPSGAVTMTHLLAATNSIQVNLATTGSVAQSQVLTAANSVQVNLSDSGRMLLTPGYWYNESAEISPWVINPDGSTIWSHSPPTTSIWS